MDDPRSSPPVKIKNIYHTSPQIFNPNSSCLIFLDYLIKHGLQQIFLLHFYPDLVMSSQAQNFEKIEQPIWDYKERLFRGKVCFQVNTLLKLQYCKPDNHMKGTA